MKDNHSDKVHKSAAQKGYYMVLLLCILAVGITGYVFLTQPGGGSNASLSVPLKPRASGKALPSSTMTDEFFLPDEPVSAPVWPVQGETIRPFSAKELTFNETTHDWRLHDAMDIAADGQDVCACMDGTVKSVGKDDAFGWTVTLSHEGGYETIYASLAEKPCVSVGEAVFAGDRLGTVGDTATVETLSAPHLHFRVLRYGQAVDPAELFS